MTSLPSFSNIKKVSATHYDVKSSRTNEIYMVDIGHNTCTCMDFTRKGFYKNQKYKCKHIKMVEDDLKQRLEQAFKNDKSYVQKLSENTSSEIGQS